MKRVMMIVVMGLAAAAGPALLAQVRTAETRLKSAQHAEEVEGDLKGAIEQYKVVARSGDRALEARALIRMAECYRKLGDAEARQVYQRILKLYADQPEAATLARARLNGEAAPSVRGDRAVWTGPNVDLFGRVSPDGRFITYTDWGVGDLAVHDVLANTDRALTTAGRTTNYSQFAEYSAVSRDGRHVAYTWFSDKGIREIRVMPLQDAGAVPPRTVLAGTTEIRFIGLRDWSPDGKSIAAGIWRTDGTGQLAIIGVADGSVRVLKSFGWTGPESIFFSADGRYVAYDLPAKDNSGPRDVFITAVDASRDTRAVDHIANDAVLGWSPDGRQLLFSSDRTGSIGLWSLPVTDGRPQGPPELIRAEFGSGISLGVSNAGTLYVFRQTSSRDLKLAPFDLAAGKLGTPAPFARGFLPRARDPHWSPDGKYIAYQAGGDGESIAIRSVDSGEVRTLRARGLLYVRNPEWSPDGRTLVVAARDTLGRNGIFTVDAQTGETSPVVMGPGFGSSPQWSRDGHRIYFVRNGVVERDLVTGAERQLTDRPVARGIAVSPDGRFIAARGATDDATKKFAILLVSTADGSTRELLPLTQGTDWGSTHTAEWTRDGKDLLVVRKGDERYALLRVPIDGSAVKTLDVDPRIWIDGAEGGVDRGFSLSPDGRHLAFLTGKTAAEVWAVENTFPSRTSIR